MRVCRLPPPLLGRRFLTAWLDFGLRPLQKAGWMSWCDAERAPPLGRLGDLEVRLAVSAGEVRRAQALRYGVFYEEMSAIPNAEVLEMRRDADSFDLISNHLVVLDNGDLRRPWLRLRPTIVGTYRLLLQDIAERHGGFYSAGEYDLGPLLDRKAHLRFLELGRSCVLAPYRNRRTVELLWHGIWTYALMHGVDAMIGCASLEGTDPDRLAVPLSFLHHTALAPVEWRVSALEHLRVEMDRLPPSRIDTRAAFRTLPPLIKGYLRLGAYVGDGAVVDHQFGTTDVFIILPVPSINSHYVNHYGADASRYAS
jgi:L-ornithine Nalpha-acyltransferase